MKGQDSKNLTKIVYIADDKEANFNALKLVIEEALPQCKVSHAPGGQEIVDMVQRGKPDLVLMDIVMPGMDGIQATRQIRKKYTKKDLPIVAMTAREPATDPKWVLDSGCNEYLAKPFQVRDLMEKIFFYLGL